MNCADCGHSFQAHGRGREDVRLLTGVCSDCFLVDGRDKPEQCFQFIPPFTHYHGGPITPYSAARKVWGFAFVSYEYPRQLELAKHSAGYALDNGAFTAWKQGRETDFAGYTKWVAKACKVDRYAPQFAIVPDIIDGSEADNDRLLEGWPEKLPGAPVWHLHETVDRLVRLCSETASGRWERVCFGSSGEWATPGTAGWWSRMREAMDAICDIDGRPPCKLHGLRMLSPKILPRLGGFVSADSANVAINHHRKKKPGDLAKFIERHVPPDRWERSGQRTLFEVKNPGNPLAKS